MNNQDIFKVLLGFTPAEKAAIKSSAKGVLEQGIQKNTHEFFKFVKERSKNLVKAGRYQNKDFLDAVEAVMSLYQAA